LAELEVGKTTCYTNQLLELYEILPIWFPCRCKLIPNRELEQFYSTNGWKSATYISLEMVMTLKAIEKLLPQGKFDLLLDGVDGEMPVWGSLWAILIIEGWLEESALVLGLSAVNVGQTTSMLAVNLRFIAWLSLVVDGTTRIEVGGIYASGSSKTPNLVHEYDQELE